MRRELREILRTLRRAVARIGIERATGSQLLDLLRRAARPRPAELSRRSPRGKPSTRSDDVALRRRPLAASAAVAGRWQRIPEPAILTRPNVTREGLAMILATIVLGAVLVATSPAVAGVTFGIHTPQENATFDQLVAAWQEAERLGFDQAWAYEHCAALTGNK